MKPYTKSPIKNHINALKAQINFDSESEMQTLIFVVIELIERVKILIEAFNECVSYEKWNFR